jgi:nicotinamidase-related amidase
MSALVLLDLQRGIIDRLGDDASSYLGRVSKAIEAARAARIPIIHVKTCFRPGHPEICDRNRSAERIKSAGGFVEGDASVEICPEVAPIHGEAVVTKRRVSGFSGSDLECVLRGTSVNSLVIGGIATSGAVLSTVRQAADLDYSLTVLHDLCYDQDDEVHQVLMEKVFAKQATIMTSEKWIQQLSSPEHGHE